MPWASSSRRADLPANWEAIRRQVLARDGGRCVKSMRDGTRCPTREGLEVDHIGDPQDHDEANLQTLCRWHHRQKTQAESGAARRRRPRERRARPAESHPGLL